MSAARVTAWWPLTRKVAGAVSAYLGVEGAAFVGELTTGTPGWTAVIAGAIPGGIALFTAYVLRDASSP